MHIKRGMQGSSAVDGRRVTMQGLNDSATGMVCLEESEFIWRLEWSATQYSALVLVVHGRRDTGLLVCRYRTRGLLIQTQIAFRSVL